MQADMTFMCLLSEQAFKKSSNTILNLNKVN